MRKILQGVVVVVVCKEQTSPLVSFICKYWVVVAVAEVVGALSILNASK